MKRLLYPFVLAMLCGCIYDDPEPCRRCDDISVTLSVRSDKVETLTRTTDEDAVTDVNLYLLGRSNTSAVHVYSTSDMLTFKCRPDEYDVYVLANIHEDLGEMTAMQLEEFNFEQRDFDVSLPMTGRTELRIASGVSSLTLPPLEVRRAVAKVSCNISVLPEDMELLSAQLLCVPRTSRPFDAAAIPPDADDDYTDMDVLPLDGRQASVEYYMLPNPQGENTAITDQRQKDAANAPAHATYLRLRAQRGDRVLTYRVYLGENSTSDFNARANTHYTFDIAILGDETVDTRISSYEVAIYDDFEKAAYGGYCFVDENRQLHLDVVNYGEIPALRAEVKIIKGDPAALRLDGRTLTEPAFVDLTTGDNAFAIEYAPVLFDVSNRELRYTVCVEDAHGFKRMTEMSHTFANNLEANIWSRSTTNGEGSIRISGHLYDREISSATHNRLVLCNEGCVLTAEPATGCTFEGWFADDRFKVPVATTPQYRYVATAHHGVLYAKFKRIDGTPLDTSGTANCYLAPQLETWYSFKATTRGNGKHSPGLSQTALNGVESRILWESGATTGAVLLETFFRAGRIYIRTGTTWGNAVVGLFDAAGTCVWSWHIWATDYDPEAKTQQVDGGAIFMDRNLGALGDHRIRIEGKGLYYQWGRKDPFPHPAAHGSGILAPVSVLEGYEFGVHDTNEPFMREDFSVAWSVAHPTIFLHYISSGRWCYASESALWHTPNVSGSGKTAYDPCPPGWRVPRSSAWAVDKMYSIYTVSGCGVGMRHRPNIAQTIDYPYTGTLQNSLQQLRFTRTDADVELWCADMKTAGAAKAYRLSIIDGQASVSDTDAILANAHPVRCIKE